MPCVELHTTPSNLHRASYNPPRLTRAVWSRRHTSPGVAHRSTKAAERRRSAVIGHASCCLRVMLSPSSMPLKLSCTSAAFSTLVRPRPVRVQLELVDATARQILSCQSSRPPPPHQVTITQPLLSSPSPPSPPSARNCAGEDHPCPSHPRRRAIGAVTPSCAHATRDQAGAPCLDAARLWVTSNVGPWGRGPHVPGPMETSHATLCCWAASRNQLDGLDSFSFFLNNFKSLHVQKFVQVWFKVRKIWKKFLCIDLGLF
jgi:hypothetical protein